MKRADALKLIGTRVQAWTSANGIYVGECYDITHDRPWRALVRIQGVISCGVHYELGKTILGRGKRVGDVIEVGGVNVSPCDAAGLPSYAEAVMAAAENFERTDADYLAGKHGDPQDPKVMKYYGWQGAAAKAYRVVAKAKQDLEPIEEALTSMTGIETVRQAMRDMVEAGLLPGRENLLSRENYAWEAMAMAIIRDEVSRHIETPFRTELVERLQALQIAPKP